jgi:hypothetical protein
MVVIKAQYSHQSLYLNTNENDKLSNFIDRLLVFQKPGYDLKIVSHHLNYMEF